MKDKILNSAKALEGRLIEHEKFLREHPETGFDLKETKGYVKKSLEELGLTAVDCGKCGVVAYIEGKKKCEGEGRVFLLRADMDALVGIDPNEPYRAMHACGHHMHTAMLLGAAEILLQNAEDFCGGVKLMFQGAEETLEGARDMIENGVLEAPRPDGAMMLHVMSGVRLPRESVVVARAGVSAPGADFFTITVRGRGTHGAMPQFGVDPILISAQIISALCEIGEREIGLTQKLLLTFGSIKGGKNANAIPEEVVLEGSLRSFDENVRENAKLRICEISHGIAKTFRGEAMVNFLFGCPSLVNDMSLCKIMKNSFSELFGEEKVFFSDELASLSMGGGSEDFANVSREIPSVVVSVCAGDSKDGYCYPLHNAGVRFDSNALWVGAAAYAYGAVSFLSK